MKTKKIEEKISQDQKSESNKKEDSKIQSAISSIDEQLNLFAEIIIDLIIIEQNEKKQATN